MAEYGNITFMVWFTSVKEVSPSGEIVQQFDFEGHNFTLSAERSAVVDTYELFVAMPNNASVQISYFII